MKVEIYSQPSEKQTWQFGSNASKRMQDAHVYTLDTKRRLATFAALDWANSYRGPKTVRDSQTAKDRSLRVDTNLHTAEVGSTTARKTILENQGIYGKKLIMALNEEIRTACARIGIIPKRTLKSQRAAYLEKNRDKTTTGSVGHVLLTPSHTRVTAVNDVFVHMDGQLVAGQELLFDAVKSEIIDSLAHKTKMPRQDIHMLLNPELTVMQRLRLQNNPLEDEFSFSVIDGTKTISHDFCTRDTNEINSVLIYTDGLKQERGKRAKTIHNLKLVNPEYCEQTALHITNIHDFSKLEVSMLPREELS